MIPFVYHLSSWTARHVLLPMYTRMEVIGGENVPPEGPLIIASNHLNDADPGILCGHINRMLVFMTKAELFKYPVLSHYLRAFGTFPVRRGEADMAALREAGALLARDRAIVVFPEGTREGSPERLAKAHAGAAFLALRHDVTVLPVAIRGSGSLSMPKLFLRPFLRRPRVRLAIGTPFRLERPQRLTSDAVEDGTRQIMERIAALLPEGHRGYYEYISERDGDAIAPQGS